MKRKLAENLRRIEQRIADACAKAKRDPARVTLVAVTKTASLDIIRALVDLGVGHIGESRVQELTKRAAMVNEWLGRRARGLTAGARPRPQWHMVGHLQRNKVRTLLPWVDVIHSVDSLRLAEQIDHEAEMLGRTMPILMQVNVAGESQKHGVAVPAVVHLIEQIVSLRHLQIRGMTAMAPLTEDQGIIRAVFERAHELFEEIVGERVCGPQFTELSMGMSQDFEIAIECGATFVRIGTALYQGIELAPQSTVMEPSD